MADVSKIKLPNNSEYDIKDASAIHSVKTINNQSIVGTGNIDIDASSKNAWYGTCSVDKATGNKIVTTTTEDFAFETGSMLRVLFEDSNTQPSLNLIVDDGDPVPVKKIGAQGDIIPIDYTQLSSYQYRTYSLSEPLEVGSTIKVTINLNSPAGSQNFYTDSVTYISGTAESTMMFVYENQYIRLSFDGYSYVEVFSSYQWSVGISGSINTGSGYIGSESFVGYWHAGSVLDFVFDGECFVLSDGGTNYKNVWYGVCPTYGGNTDKMVTTVTGDFVLIPGNIIRVKFDNGTSTSITRLSVDGTEATNVSNVGSGGSTSYMWSPGEVVDFVYDGNVYIMSDGGTATTTYYGATKLSSSTSSTSTSLAATPSAVKSAYDLANSKVSDVQVDGTSVVSSGTATISTSSTPTADTIAKFDSDAHMNSADMTTQEIDDFVDSVPSAFDNLNNLSVLHDITAGGNVEAAGDVTADGNSILDALYFKPGDTYVAVGRYAGLCTNASKDMQLSLVLPKSAKYCAGFTITNITGGVRISTGGYADNVGDGTSWSGRSGISFGGALYNEDGTNHASGDGKDAYMCTANIIKTSAFKQNGTTTDVVNNTPVTLGGNITIEFT